ncbi:hypothetical protein ACHAWF_001530 [Thalassiosira exigua]
MKYLSTVFLTTIIPAAPQTCDGVDRQYQKLFDSIGGLVHRRMKAFDAEDIDGYLQGASNDVNVQVQVHDETVVDGISDLNEYRKVLLLYRKVFSTILQSFKDRQVWGFHTMPELFYRVEEGTALAHVDYNMEECDKRDADCVKTWKSSGHFRLKMRQKDPTVAFSADAADWEIYVYKVYVMSTSEEFGKTSDGCDGLC